MPVKYIQVKPIDIKPFANEYWFLVIVVFIQTI